MPITFAQILQVLISYKYYILFPLATIEGSIVTVIAGFLSAQGLMNVYFVYLVVMAGDLTGDMLYYALGRWGFKPAFERRGKLSNIFFLKVKALQAHFVRHSGKTLLFGKMAHGVGSILLTAAGASRVSFGKFIIFNVFGTVLKSLILVLVGYYFGSAYARINHYFDWLALGTLALAALFLALYFFTVQVSKEIERDL